MRLVEQARSIFDDLGYTVEGTGPNFRAERDWKVVHVSTTLEEVEQPASTDEFRCFVADPNNVDELEHRLTSTDPAYEWAIIVADGDEYEVERAPPVIA
ncbi:DUF7116 family protein [Halovivax gelatinilyticus]|uniref:DUF7116 family protein n=1 Tax=Halovivax gelatinilyticus TaxID=2961597 RepID=UPI0020CA7E4C|nr:hypothetical protein [Halovivax gelatinilyticus]